MVASKTSSSDHHKKNSHWSISDFYNQSWDLTWQNKKLWILGLAVSLFASGGGGGGNSSFDASDFQQFQENQQQEQQLPESPYSDFEVVEEAGAHNGEIHGVDVEAQEDIRGPVGVGLHAMEFGQKREEMLTPFVNGLKNVPLHVWAIIGLEFLMVVVGLIVFGLFLGTWSQGALIQGIAQAAVDKKIELAAISSYAVTKVTSLIWISLIPLLKFIVLALLIGAGGAIALAFVNALADGLGFISVIAGIVAVCWFFYKLIRLAFAINYAFYYCVEENLSGQEAYDQAYALVDGNIWKSIRLALANAIVTGIVVFAVFLPVLGVGFGTVMRDLMNDSFTPMTFVPVGITFLLTIPAMTLIQGILKVFTYSTWHYAFRALKK
ncbi:MAG TPA: hypothetical protein VF209_01600 [Patescibacteria group bacterium]